MHRQEALQPHPPDCQLQVDAFRSTSWMLNPCLRLSVKCVAFAGPGSHISMDLYFLLYSHRIQIAAPEYRWQLFLKNIGLYSLNHLLLPILKLSYQQEIVTRISIQYYQFDKLLVYHSEGFDLTGRTQRQRHSIAILAQTHWGGASGCLFIRWYHSWKYQYCRPH